MKQFVARAIVAAAFSALTASAQAQTAYQLVDLGMLPGCGTSAAMGVSNSGEVVGSCGLDNGFNTQNGWTSINGSLAPIGKLAGGTYSVAVAASAAGDVVGNGDAGNFRPQAILVRRGQVINIDPVTGGNANAIGITDAGAIFGNMTTSLGGSPSSWRAVMWTEDPAHPGRFRRTQLPMPAGGTTKTTGVYALASSNGGYVAGWATSNVIGQQGALWSNDATHTLTVLFGLGGTTIAQGVNSFGEAVGFSYGANGLRAVAWGTDAAHTITDLGALPGDSSSMAYAVNDLGQVLAVSANATTGDVHPFVYSNGQSIALAALLDATAAGWTIDQPAAINNAGQIVGSGLLNGQRRAFVLIPY